MPLCAQTLLGRSFALSLPSSPSIPIPTAHPGTVGLPAELQLPAWVPSPVLGSSVSLARGRGGWLCSCSQLTFTSGSLLALQSE